MAASATLGSAANLLVRNTGVNVSNTLVSSGASTAFWTLSSKPGGASQAIGSNPFRYFNGAYASDTVAAAWVSPGSDGTAGVGGVYTYDLSVDLTGFDPATASISGTFSTDNEGSIYLNSDNPVATNSGAAFGSMHAFTLNSGFVAGLNTIHVTVNNAGDPTAFIVQFSSATATPNVPGVPVPASVWLTIAGLTLVGFYMGYRHRSGLNF
ncbi:MAG: hypothetical protein ABL967_13070 [Bryobacteraceae bacterium]